MTRSPILHELRRNVAAYSRALDRADTLTAERYRLVVAADAAGIPRAEVAAILGITRQALAQFVERRRDG